MLDGVYGGRYLLGFSSALLKGCHLRGSETPMLGDGGIMTSKETNLGWHVATTNHEATPSNDTITLYFRWIQAVCFNNMGAGVDATRSNKTCSG